MSILGSGAAFTPRLERSQKCLAFARTWTKSCAAADARVAMSFPPPKTSPDVRLGSTTLCIGMKLF
jgi:hypothetical protein